MPRKNSKAASVGGLFHLGARHRACGQGCNPANQLIVKYALTPTNAVTAKENAVTAKENDAQSNLPPAQIMDKMIAHLLPESG